MNDEKKLTIEETIINTCGICQEIIKKPEGYYEAISFYNENQGGYKIIQEKYSIELFSLHTMIPPSHLECQKKFREILKKLSMFIMDYNNSTNVSELEKKEKNIDEFCNKQQEKIEELCSKLKIDGVITLRINPKDVNPELALSRQKDSIHIQVFYHSLYQEPALI